MVRGAKVYLIDFQGARLGPFQYDLASLLIDPYVDMPEGMQNQLISYALSAWKRRRGLQSDDFMRGYRHLALCRNLQALGAFGYLSKEKKKPFFESHIPTALRRLKTNIRQLGASGYPRLAAVVEAL